MKPLITALVDTYNHERYIEQALVSVLEQGLSATEMEVIVVDDGSTDKTPSIVQKFVPRVKHVRKINGGQASAFNAGFAQAQGEIVAILDGDDWWAAKKVTTVVEALEQNPHVAAVGHGHFKFYEDTNELEACVPPGRMLVNMEMPCAVRSWPFLLMGALTVRRSLLEWIMPIPENMIFMADSAIQAAATIMGTLVLEEPLFYYRWHRRNLFAFDSRDASNAASLRRKAEMSELVYEGVSKRLRQLGVPSEQVSTMLGDACLDSRRSRLLMSGGRRVEAFQTEMQCFHRAYKNPTFAYRLYKYFVLATATMLLPPQRFYKLRQWYANHELGRYRNWFLREDAAGSKK
ncbi:MAG: glycosyltransferase family A protein [Candidatus Acidiferrum sp.]|jgi:glycosyltransferase involved in cell wall biosynthesis